MEYHGYTWENTLGLAFSSMNKSAVKMQLYLSFLACYEMFFTIKNIYSYKNDKKGKNVEID